jgi:hypothetical protein
MKLSILNARGIGHTTIILAVVIVFAIVGVAYKVSSEASVSSDAPSCKTIYRKYHGTPRGGYWLFSSSRPPKAYYQRNAPARYVSCLKYYFPQYQWYREQGGV